jgi:hypothetical protein
MRRRRLIPRVTPHLVSSALTARPKRPPARTLEFADAEEATAALGEFRRSGSIAYVPPDAPNRIEVID